MRVIGIDPAPKKKTTICDPDGEDENIFREVAATKLADEVNKLAPGGKSCLICWDAPLVGPPLAESSQKTDHPYNRRPIEAFFAKGRSTHPFGTHGVTGISVQSYTGCPHWALTQAVLGYPRTGEYSQPASELPFELQTDPEFSANGRPRKVVEVHPALALWLIYEWLMPEKEKHFRKKNNEALFKYKGNGSTHAAEERLFSGLKHFVKEDAAALKVVDQIENNNLADDFTDDRLDALTAWCLGKLWVNKPGKVRLLGNDVKGTFLLPIVEGLEKQFANFVA